jgi:hypothetical protein
MSRDVIVDTVSVQGVCSPEEKENGDFMDVISWEVLSVQEIIISLEPEPGYWCDSTASDSVFAGVPFHARSDE